MDIHKLEGAIFIKMVLFESLIISDPRYLKVSPGCSVLVRVSVAVKRDHSQLL